MPRKTNKVRTCTGFQKVTKAASAQTEVAELEQAAATYRTKGWTAEEDAILKTYYLRVPRELLAKHLPRRTVTAIQARAARLRANGVQLEIDKQE